MNKAVAEKWLTRYPKLENFIAAGTISLKAAREILDVDRYFMYDVYKEMLEAVYDDINSKGYEYALDYSENAKGWATYNIIEVFEKE